MSDNGKIYLSVKEVPVQVVPKTNRRTHWEGFYEEVKLRLEKTTRGYALCYEFADRKLAGYARSHLLKRLKRDGLPAHFVELTGTHKDEIGVLYVRRGAAYGG